MQESNNTDITKTDNEPIIIKTDIGAKDGQDARLWTTSWTGTDIETNIKNGKLRCNFCRHEFEPEKVSGMVTDLKNLQGQIMGSGAQDIIADTKDVLTFKCSSCGAEVVIDTASSSQARCHWCRNILSVNQQIPNGSIPDVVLPFSINKDTARLEIEKFVGKRKFFANPQFKKEFTTENIMGVYFPYMVVDVNAHATFKGEGEHQTRKYYVGSGDHQKTYYDADLYHVERDFDLTIDGLSIESNSDRLNSTSKDKTNNIINAIMPFDIENCVKYNANYLRGYTSEKRDTNIGDLKKIVDIQSTDIARFACNDTLKTYDRGVAWQQEKLDIKGQQWKAAYLPVWLYSYQEVKGSKKLLHYVAVNARTKETMGSVPIHMPKLLLVSGLIEIICFFLMLFFSIVADFDYSWTFLFGGFIYFFIMYARYRNSGARHTYELETKKEMTNLKTVDNFIQKRKGLSNPTMNGANNKKVNGSTVNNNFLNSMTGKSVGNSILNTIAANDMVAGIIKDSVDKKKSNEINDTEKK